MEESNVGRKRREESPFPICFQTSRGRSFADRLYVIFVVATLPPVVIALSIVIVFGVIGLPLLSGCAVVSVVAVLTLEIGWKWILSRPKCCIVFYTDHLQVGGSLTKFAFSYDQVEIISLPVARAQGSWIRLKCGNRIVRVHLVGRERWNCLWLLRRCCRNAVFVDERGREHLPANPVEIDQTLNALKGHHKRRISVCVGGGLFLRWHVFRLRWATCTVVEWEHSTERIRPRSFGEDGRRIRSCDNYCDPWCGQIAAGAGKNSASNDNGIRHARREWRIDP